MADARRLSHAIAPPFRAVALAFVLAACGAGSAKLLGAPVHQPIALVFTGTPEVAAKSDRRGMNAMAATLLEGMKKKGLVGYVPAEGQAAPPPRIELFVKRWDALGGHRLTGYWAGVLFGVPALVNDSVHAKDVQVECRVVREGESAEADRRLFTGETGDDIADQVLSHAFSDERTLAPPAETRAPRPR
jgi:hypothetical protein